MIGKAPRHDEDTGVQLSDLKPGDGEPDEVVAVPGHKDPTFRGREPKLIDICVPAPVDLVDGDGIEAEASGDLRRRGIEILVEEEPHRRPGLAAAGACEGQLGLDPLRCPMRFALQAGIDLLRIELVVPQG